VTSFGGRQVTPAGAAAYNPAFDVTPPDLVTAIVSECGIAAAPLSPDTLRVLLASAGRSTRRRRSPFPAARDHQT
jgi:methylthioribose-1-phosphate isomerase